MSSLYYQILEKYHNPDSKKTKKKTILFAKIVHNFDELVIYNNLNLASARFNPKKLRRLIGMLSNMQSIALIIRLICYLYIMPFLRISLVVFLVIFRLYHFSNPVFINDRIMNSRIVASIWTNYEFNKLQIIEQRVTPINTLYPSINHNVTTSILSMIKTNLSNIGKQLNHIGYELYRSNNNTQYQGYSSYSSYFVSKKNFEHVKSIKQIVKKKTSSLLEQIKITPPQLSIPEISNNYFQKHKPNSKKFKSNKGHKTKKLKEKIKDYLIYTKNTKYGKIYGYILHDKGIAVIIENEDVYIYKLPKHLLDKYEKV
jgi:hypothetical protein